LAGRYETSTGSPEQLEYRCLCAAAETRLGVSQGEEL
jgi:hypothetical protein